MKSIISIALRSGTSSHKFVAACKWNAKASRRGNTFGERAHDMNLHFGGAHFSPSQRLRRDVFAFGFEIGVIHADGGRKKKKRKRKVYALPKRNRLRLHNFLCGDENNIPAMYHEITQFNLQTAYASIETRAHKHGRTVGEEAEKNQRQTCCGRSEFIPFSNTIQSSKVHSLGGEFAIHHFVMCNLLARMRYLDIYTTRTGFGQRRPRCVWNIQCVNKPTENHIFFFVHWKFHYWFA